MNHKKILFLLIVAAFFLPAISFGQSVMFNESNYSLIKQEQDSSSAYVRTYRNNGNPSYTLKKMYVDSAYRDVLSTVFYKDSLLEGPITIYNKGNVILQGSYKNGKWDGERLTYVGTQVVQKATYLEGIKTGTWEEYNPSGRLMRRITYDTAGKAISDLRY